MDDERLSVRRFDSVDDVDRTSVDCIVVDSVAAIDELASVDETAPVDQRVETQTPTVLYDPDGDATVAARATRSGVSEYVTDAALDGETLADRILAVVERSGSSVDHAASRGHGTGGRDDYTAGRDDYTAGRDDHTAGRDDHTAGRDDETIASPLELFHGVATDTDSDLAEKLEQLLDVGCELLGVEDGFLAEVDEETFSIEATVGDHPQLQPDVSTPLSETFCRWVVDGDGHVSIQDVEATVEPDDPARLRWDVGCYLGGEVVVDGELYGALCFADRDPRERAFSSEELRFVELLVDWLEHELERENRLRSLRRYRAVHETLEGMVVVVGRDARIELVTEPLAERFGYDREELVGTSALEFVGEEVVQKGYEALQRLGSDAESVTVETTADTAAGEPVPVEIEFTVLSSSTEFEGLVGVVSDRTELKLTRNELEAERDRFQQLFDRLPDAVVDTDFVDGEPMISDVNPAFEETFGYEESAVVGRSVNDIIVPPEYREEARQLDDVAMRRGSNLAEVERETVSGRRTFLFRGFLYTTDEDGDRGFGIYTDVSERLEQERRLRVLHRVLRHNLRNDMTAILGYADLLTTRTSDVEHEYVERIREQAEEVASLGEQVQRIEHALDQESRRRVPVDPAAVASGVVEQFRERCPEAEIRLSVEDDSDVVADELLELAIENLVENAIEHTDGVPTVTVEIAPSPEQPESWLELTVRDDGPGIPDRERAVVSGDEAITQLNHSRGLGLWMTRWIAEGVGGGLEFPDPEVGAAVTIRLQRMMEQPSV